MMPTLLTYGSIGLVYSIGELATFILAVSLCCAEEDDADDEFLHTEAHRTTRLDEECEKEIEVEEAEEVKQKKLDEENNIREVRNGNNNSNNNGNNKKNDKKSSDKTKDNKTNRSSIEMVEAKNGKVHDKSVDYDELGKDLKK